MSKEQTKEQTFCTDCLKTKGMKLVYITVGTLVPLLSLAVVFSIDANTGFAYFIFGSFLAIQGMLAYFAYRVILLYCTTNQKYHESNEAIAGFWCLVIVIISLSFWLISEWDFWGKVLVNGY